MSISGDAVESLSRAIELGADGAAIRIELASALEQAGRLEEAIPHLRRAVAIDPQSIAAHVNLGALLEKLDQTDEAIHWAQRAVTIGPNHEVAHYNLARMRQSQGQLQEAIAGHSKAIDLEPQFALAYANRGCCRLLEGDFAAGWADYQWRLRTGQWRPSDFQQPPWDGRPLADGSLLVHGEQGIGDEILFASCLPDVIPIVQNCLLVCDPRLVKLMARSFSTVAVVGHNRKTEPSLPALPFAADAQIPSGSLPSFVRRSADSFPMRKQFLVADPEQKRMWQQRFAGLGSGLKIGISWRGGGTWEERRKRTTVLDQWRELLAVPGAQFINLQYGDCAAELIQAKEKLGITIHHFDEADPLGDLDAFAAKVAALDLVISIDNANVHLAGALGVATWCLVPYVPAWAWGMHGAKTLWYPSVKIVRQTQLGDWSTAISATVADLQGKSFFQGRVGRVRETHREMTAHGGSSLRSTHPTFSPNPKNDLPGQSSFEKQPNLDLKPNLQQLVTEAIARFNESQFDEARQLAEQILAVDANNIVGLRILGTWERKQNQCERSLELLDRAIQLAPKNAELHFERGLTYTEQKLHREAYECFVRSTEIDPAFQPAYVNIGAILEQQERFDEALRWSRQAVELKPDCPLANYNLANQFRECGAIADALRHYRRAAELKPDYHKAKWNAGICHMLLGQLPQAWPLFECRELADEVKLDKYPQPRWDGSSLAGKTIVVHAEQGIGDEILFANCFADVIAQAEKAILVCEPRLVALFKRSYPKAAVYGWARRNDWSPASLAEKIDWQIAAGSLPLYLRNRIEDFPRVDHYLLANPSQVEYWRQKFAALGSGLKIGISWRAGGKSTESRKRTVPLLEWQSVLSAPDVQFINLQYGDITQDLADAEREFGVRIHDWEQGDPLVDMDSYAAKIAALDLVISIDNAAVHVAGALGVPVWTMLPRVPSWRWFMIGDTNPWFPTMRLFRQSERLNWKPVIEQISARLQEIAGAAGQDASREEMAVRIHSVMPSNVAGKEGRIESKAAPSNRWLTETEMYGRQTSQTIERLEQDAEAAQTAGNLPEAQQAYRKILQITPRHMKSHVGLGIIARQTGHFDVAIRCFQRALTIFESHAAHHALLAGALVDAGRIEQGLAHSRRAVELDAARPEAQRELGRALHATGQHVGAIAALERALQSTPADTNVIGTLARSMAANGRLDAALDMLRNEIKKSPASAALHVALGEVLFEDQSFDDAQRCFGKAIELSPTLGEAHFQLARLFQHQGKIEQAIAADRTALEHAPQHVAAMLHLGKLLRQSDAATDAEPLYRRAIELRGETAELRNLLGATLAELGHCEKAIEQYDQGLRLRADYAPLHSNRALSLVQLERFGEGWDEYEWRWRSGQPDRFGNKLTKPNWNGSSLAEKSILIYSEQGVGDEIMFGSCYPDVIRQARRCVILCDVRLQRLLRRSFPEAMVMGTPRGSEHLWNLPPSLSIDVKCPAGSLPRFVRRSVDDFPRQRQLLRPDAAVVAQWRQRFAALRPGKKIGISWRTGETAREAARRSTTLAQWQPLFELPGIQWINLQYGDSRAELASAAQHGANIYDAASADHQFDLDGLAAKIAALDLVITVDNTTAHLAAAVGTPTWIALPQPADWRWLSGRDDSIWYEQVRLFRQNGLHQWNEVFQRLRRELLKPTYRLDEKSNMDLPAAPHWSKAQAPHEVE